jgi:hypothetical protein
MHNPLGFPTPRRLPLLAAALLLGGCNVESVKTSLSQPFGGGPKVEDSVVVDVLSPPSAESGEDCRDVSLIVLDVRRQDSHVRVPRRTLREVRGQAEDLLTRFKYLTPVREHLLSDEALSDERYYRLNVVIADWERNAETKGAFCRKSASVALHVSLERGGLDGRVCNTLAETGSYTAQRRTYECSRLPADADMAREATRRALDRAIRRLVPVPESTLRPVRRGSGEVAAIADRLKGGDCAGALQAARAYLEGHPDDADAQYDAALAAECIAARRSDQQGIVEALGLARQHYQRSLALDSEDSEAQRASSEVSYAYERYAKAQVLQSTAARLRGER